MIGDDETNFPHKLLLANSQLANLRKLFITRYQLSKTQLSKMIQSGGFLSRLLGSLLSLAFSITTGFVKKLLKTRNKKKKHNKIVMLARTKLNSIESKRSEVLINNEISHEDFMTILNEEKKYRELKESIRMMNSQRSDVEKISLI